MKTQRLRPLYTRCTRDVQEYIGHCTRNVQGFHASVIRIFCATSDYVFSQNGCVADHTSNPKANIFVITLYNITKFIKSPFSHPPPPAPGKFG